MVVKASRAVLPVVVLSVGLAGCASDANPVLSQAPVQQSHQSIAGGVDDATHTDVVGIAIVMGRGIASCSGSLITPTLVLTARHCVSPVDETGVICAPATINGMMYTTTLTAAPFDVSAFHVTTDANISFNSHFTNVAEVIVPDGSTGASLCGHDIALLRLAAPLTASAGLIVPRLDIPPVARETFTASGYGGTDDNGTGAGQRRMRDSLTVQLVGHYAARGVTVLEDQEWAGDQGTCRGDSGGPALDELGAVIGVLSRGAANNCIQPIYTRVDAFADFLRAQAARAAMLDGYAAPAWVTPPGDNPGSQGDACNSDNECDEAQSLTCLPTGTARECTITDCTACPDAWICNDAGNRCVRDPSRQPPPVVDAGPPVVEDAGPPVVADAGTVVADAGTDASAGTPTTASASSSCDVGRVGGGASGRVGALALLAGAAVAGRRRRRA